MQLSSQFLIISISVDLLGSQHVDLLIIVSRILQQTASKLQPFMRDASSFGAPLNRVRVALQIQHLVHRKKVNAFVVFSCYVQKE